MSFQLSGLDVPSRFKDTWTMEPSTSQQPFPGLVRVTARTSESGPGTISLPGLLRLGASAPAAAGRRVGPYLSGVSLHLRSRELDSVSIGCPDFTELRWSRWATEVG